MSLDIWTGQSSTHKFHSRRAKALQIHHPTDPTLFSNLPPKSLDAFNKLQPPGSPPAPLGDAPKTGGGLPGFQASILGAPGSERRSCCRPCGSTCAGTCTRSAWRSWSCWSTSGPRPGCRAGACWAFWIGFVGAARVSPESLTNRWRGGSHRFNTGLSSGSVDSTALCGLGTKQI